MSLYLFFRIYQLHAEFFLELVKAKNIYIQFGPNSLKSIKVTQILFGYLYEK